MLLNLQNQKKNLKVYSCHNFNFCSIFIAWFKHFSGDFITERYKKLNNTSERVDMNNYRILLWNSMVDFGDLIEQKNKDVVIHFLQFIRQDIIIFSLLL